MDVVTEYKQFRQVDMRLNTKIMKLIEHDLVMKSAKLLNMKKWNKIVFRADYELDVLMDFIIHEHINGGKTIAQSYLETKGWTNDIEKQLLNAFICSYTSLFKVNSIIEADKAVILSDILNDGKEIKLIDIGFSKSFCVGRLVFTRVLSLQHFNMTSGVSFPFLGGREEYLLQRYREITRKNKIEDESIARFVAFFELHRTDGMSVEYRNVR